MGARVVAADRTMNMVAYQGTLRWPALAADALALPFVDGAFDAALAGFLVNRLAPAPVLAELARAVRAHGAVLASSWAAEAPDPVKIADRWRYRLLGLATARVVRGNEDGGGADIRLSRGSGRGGPRGRAGQGACIRAPSRSGGAGASRRRRLPPRHAHIAPWVAELDGLGRSELIRQGCHRGGPAR